MRRLVLFVLTALVLAPPAGAATAKSPQLVNLHIDNGSTPFAGDNRQLTTISPNGDGFRDAAHIRFSLAEPATVTMEVTRTVKVPHVVYSLTQSFPVGKHVMLWTPTGLNPRTYLIRMTSIDAKGHRVVYGAPNAFVGRYPRGLVVRLQGIDAGFSRPSYAPGQVASIHIATDEPTLTFQVFHAGPEKYVTYADNQFGGVALDRPPTTLVWTKWINAPHSITFRIPDVPSGLYYVQFGGTDGRIGYAPFVVRPAVFGVSSRVLVVLPTNTWQAYNFQDVDGNGYGDTWYAGPPNRSVELGRTYIARGVPPRYYRYDLPFLHWLYWGNHDAEFISDSEFDTIASGEQLAAAYDLIIFEGHEEYVTLREYNLVQRYRDLGGNLAFLSANNFFWHVQKSKQRLQKIGEWRDSGRPEAAVIGAQYRANDNGTRRGQYSVVNAASAPWFWANTTLTDGSLFGNEVGGFGIEIDGTAAASPPGTIVLAQIPDLFGVGKTAEMTYYEQPNGAKVFAAGALNFGGSVSYWPMKQLMNNLWAHLTVP